MTRFEVFAGDQMADSSSSLGGGFEPRTQTDWLELLDRDLKGRDPARLRSRTGDGIEIQPLYSEGEALCLPPRASGEIERRGRIGVEANGRIAEAIDYEFRHGTTGLILDLSTPGHSDGLAAEPADWAAVFGSVELPGTLHLRATADSLAHARAWLETATLDACAGCSLGLDPFRVAASTGDFQDLPDALDAAARLAAEAITHPARPRAFVLDAQPYSAAGATTAQSVGALLAACVQSLRALESANVDASRALETIEFCFRLDPRFFEQVAALRALRLLLLQVARACDIESPAPAFISALPAMRMLSRRDPWVNILRQTASTFAALVGGADAVGAVAFDSKLERTSELGRRVARNTPIILAEESRLGLVQDPASGSWFLDQFTREIAAQAWAFFQLIEREGGLIATMQSGWLLNEFDARDRERGQRLAHRKLPLTGVSEFAVADEKLPAPVAPPHTQSPGAWPQRSFDDAFEHLRSAVDRHAVTHARPRVFLARLGTPASFSAREGWLTNLLGAAGITAIAGDPEGDVGREFVTSGAVTAILTGDDATLATHGPSLTTTLSSFGTVWATGRPVPELERAGVANFVHIGIDVVDTLAQLLEQQGVRR
jgi:methylmalonyl-CoA mutase